MPFIGDIPMSYKQRYIMLVLGGCISASVFAGGKNDYVFWSASQYARVWMRSSRTLAVFEDDNRTKPVRILAGRNEYEERQFVITPRCDENPKKISLEVSDLVDGRGHSIGKENIRIEWMRYSLEFWKQRALTSFVPDPLKPTNIAYYDDEDYNGKVNEKTNTTFWVTFYVPEGTPVGVYRGKVTAIVDDKVKLVREVELSVLDVTLPHITHTRTALFSGPFSEWIVKDLANFRISFGMLPEDPKLFVKVGRLMHKLGVQVSFVGPWSDLYDALGITPPYRKGKPPQKALEDCREYYQWTYPILKREGWLGEAYSQMPDEFSSPKLAKRIINYIKKVRQWAPGIKIQTTAIGNLKTAKMLTDFCDVWSPSGEVLHRNLDFYLERVKSGDEVWPYIHEVLFHRTPPINIACYFRMLWRYGFNGCCYWSVGPRGKFEHTKYGVIRYDGVWPGDGSLYYPYLKVGESVGKRGGAVNNVRPPFLHSARLYLIRDGIEDLEYCWLMDKLIKEAGGVSRLPENIKAKLKSIKSFVSRFDTKFNTYPNALRAYSKPEEIEANRKDVMEVIISIKHLLSRKD